MISAMPLMPMPPMPMKWIVPISKGTRVGGLARIMRPSPICSDEIGETPAASGLRQRMRGSGAAAPDRPARRMRSAACSASFSGVRSRCATRQPAPASANTSRVGRLIVVERMRQRHEDRGPADHHQARLTVPAPRRAITRCAFAMRAGRSLKNGASSAFDARSRHRPRAPVRYLPDGIAARSQAAP